MARILITSGPTREYLDPVRFLTNASSGRMGTALAAAALETGHEVVVVSGPVDVRYPKQAQVVSVVTTAEMLEACREVFPECDGLVAAAAPCDYRPVVPAEHKIRKTGGPLELRLVETPDVVASLAVPGRSQWMVAFALETEDPRIRALQKLERKSCDLIVVNGPRTIHSRHTSLEVLDRQGNVLLGVSGTKKAVARRLMALFERELMGRPSANRPPCNP